MSTDTMKQVILETVLILLYVDLYRNIILQNGSEKRVNIYTLNVFPNKW
jgi:hypothetical protein